MEVTHDGLREVPEIANKCPAQLAFAIQAVRGKEVTPKIGVERMCPAHVPRASVDLNIELARIAKLAPLTQDLIWWAFALYPAPAEAMWSPKHLGDLDYERRCLGNIFRERARRDPAWFTRTCIESPAWVLSLSPWIKQANGYPPAGWNWRDWLKALGQADDFDLIAEDVSPATVELARRQATQNAAPAASTPRRAESVQGGLF